MVSERHEGDSWDLASGVGSTATAAAAARAIASRESPEIVNDRYAEPLVRAVGIDLLTRLASGELPPGDLVEQVAIDVAKVRPRFYDDFFLDATAAGITQVVILAAGLDSRAYRLPWPAGTVVYELDQPAVIEFKTRTLADLGAKPTTDRRAVAVDLRDDWPTALRTAGFDPALPTAWSAEGLLGYLPPEAQDLLLDTLTNLSAPGSRVATESRPGDEATAKASLDRLSDRWRAQGFDPKMGQHRYYGPRNEAAPYLTSLGWTLTATPVTTLLAVRDLALPAADDLRLTSTLYVSGVLSE
ncbi:class I SAM-dependent methyltransferase [Kribbella sp. NPDC058245]|uniref:class I SAM-dependent methyltransferase n=1 Tax=Kribbella sp. NPDC058245 TaxID=3346399 RepID=UPI0036E932B9